MKLTLKACEHRAMEVWADRNSDANCFYATCLGCYERLKFISDVADGYVIAPAPGPCDHIKKKPVASQITKHMPHRDAICVSCGQILRHPDGPGEWTPVLFYGYLIHEEAF
jgi:hypothetical protein